MSKKYPQLPPSLMKRFLHWLCKPELIEEIEGDLNEEFHERIKLKNIR
ncbi:permease prefix domain 2-containing transporter [Fulvivirgaceae bacterium BMA10]|uniref:Permease prefix domain 2-containing transporter n=1 Tax=Splendidivirga corallicola TaxID=3051826 RepID=A0ABT8KH71_9BACT|nr:permease prefix domain 2-containing transporter [Fulvivirgaceae bacterium BMA10]